MRSIVLILALTLVLVSDSEAGPKGKLLGLVAEYEDLKHIILDELSIADDNRQLGYGSDPKGIVGVAKESLDLTLTVDKTYMEAVKAMRSDPEFGANLRALYALRVAAQALHQALSTELGYQLGEKTTFNLMVRAKYEDIARVADEELKRTLQKAGEQ